MKKTNHKKRRKENAEITLAESKTKRQMFADEFLKALANILPKHLIKLGFIIIICVGALVTNTRIETIQDILAGIFHTIAILYEG